MKIVVIQDHLRSGGTERQSVLLANAFAAAAHETTLLTFRPGGALVDSVSRSVRRVILQPFDFKLDWAAPGLRAAVARAAPAVVLCMGRMANCFAGSLQRDLPQATVIATMRTGKKLPARYQRSLATARHIVANSRDARDTLGRVYGVDTRRITVIYNSLVFPAPRESAADTAMRTQFGAGPHTTVLLCVAMFRPEKNQRELVEIARGLPADVDWQLWLAGDGPARAECERLVMTRNLGARVKFPGFVRDPGGLYAAADIAVHASSSEALSNFLIEAQAHGLPVVAYAAQGMSECFLPNQTGWEIPRNQPDEFRAALLRLIHASPAERTAQAEMAKDFARRSFDPDRQVAAYLDLFARLT